MFDVGKQVATCSLVSWHGVLVSGPWWWRMVSSHASSVLDVATSEFVLKPNARGVNVYEHISRWWFQTFLIFTPTGGNDPNWLPHIFHMGWFNHQVVKMCKKQNKMGTFFFRTWMGPANPTGQISGDFANPSKWPLEERFSERFWYTKDTATNPKVATWRHTPTKLKGIKQVVGFVFFKHQNLLFCLKHQHGGGLFLRH